MSAVWISGASHGTGTTGRTMREGRAGSWKTRWGATRAVIGLAFERATEGMEGSDQALGAMTGAYARLISARPETLFVSLCGSRRGWPEEFRLRR
ncbi:hypothetical protein [Streptomyces canus]|uniref:hypothetical protein n=1 Tax=Streptomyces canus TaxID=58343 RepID=UPI00277EB60A|nr:hypothetical protein [Streptomyces canus]MDQ1064951.1 hypothetical protein [Streptomyces canus]